MLHVLSLSRLGMAAAFVLSRDDATRAALVIASGLSDVLDGWLARRWGLTTPLGAILDPACDRAFAFTAVVVLTLEGRLRPLAAALLVLRDLSTGLAWLLTRVVPAWRQVRFQARRAGKLVTVLQITTLLAVLLWPPAVVPLVAATALLALVAVADYARSLQRRAPPPQPPFEAGRSYPRVRERSA